MVRLLLFVMMLFLSGEAYAQKRIALSFDDTPRPFGVLLTSTERRAKLISALKRARVKQAVFFVNPGRIPDSDDPHDDRQIMDYVRAGHVIANHGYSHLKLSDVSASAYLADIDLAASWLKGRKGFRPWFRFPFLDEGGSDKVKRDMVREGLSARSLRNGYVTADSSDWLMDQLTIDAVTAGHAVDRVALRDFYVHHHVAAANFADMLAQQTLSRAPVQILLLHETDLAALYIEDLVAALRRDGWKIVHADEAYRDPIGAVLPDVPSTQGTLTEMMAWQKGLPAPRWYKYNNAELMREDFKANVLKSIMP